MASRLPNTVSSDGEIVTSHSRNLGSGPALRDADIHLRPMWFAAWIGSLAPVTGSWLLILLMVAFGIQDDGHTGDLTFGVAALAYGRLALAALPCAILLTFVLAAVERQHGDARTPWAVAGFVTLASCASGLIGGWLYLTAWVPRASDMIGLFAIVLVLAALGALGGEVARRVRHRGAWL